MLKIFACLLIFTSKTLVFGAPPEFAKQKFFVGIEYDKSLPMDGGSDRLRHRNNYDPFYVTISTTARNDFVLDYLEVTATTDVTGQVNFCLLQGQTGSKTMVFQLSTNNTDFLNYSFKSYGIREDYYLKVTEGSNVTC